MSDNIRQRTQGEGRLRQGCQSEDDAYELCSEVLEVWSREISSRQVRRLNRFLGNVKTVNPLQGSV
jgi:hypothetical protein